MLNCLKSNSEWESCDSNERGQPEVVCLFGTLFCCCCAHDLQKSRAGAGGGAGQEFNLHHSNPSHINDSARSLTL